MPEASEDAAHIQSVYRLHPFCASRILGRRRPYSRNFPFVRDFMARATSQARFNGGTSLMLLDSIKTR